MSNESEIFRSSRLRRGGNDVIETLSRRLGYSRKIIESRTREQEIVKARDLIVYLLREYGDLSYPAIGRLLGGRDHTTVMHACEKITKEIQLNENLVEELNVIRNRIYEV